MVIQHYLLSIIYTFVKKKYIFKISLADYSYRVILSAAHYNTVENISNLIF